MYVTFHILHLIFFDLSASSKESLRRTNNGKLIKSPAENLKIKIVLLHKKLPYFLKNSCAEYNGSEVAAERMRGGG